MALVVRTAVTCDLGVAEVSVAAKTWAVADLAMEVVEEVSGAAGAAGVAVRVGDGAAGRG